MKKVIRHPSWSDDKQCAYAAYGERCVREGTISPQIHAGGPWYCLPHYRLQHGGATEEQAAKEVRRGKAEGWRETLIQAKANALRESGDEMMTIADKLSRGIGNKQDKVEFLGLLRRRMNSIDARKKLGMRVAPNGD